jgi:regulatory protein
MFSSPTSSKTTQTALGYALRLLARKDYTRNEITEKMGEKNFSLEDISKTVIYLESKKFIDDKRVANNIIEFYGASKGKIWLKQRMIARHLNSMVMESVLSQLPAEDQYMSNDQLISLRRLIESRFKVDNWHDLQYNTKGKIFQFLIRRGYTNPLTMIQKFTEL